MFELEISSKLENYSVSIATGIVQAHSDYAAVICDDFFDYQLVFGAPVLFVPTSESVKTLKTIEDICLFLRNNNVRRDSRILAVGGGVIQDLATLASSLYMRGIKWDFMPTTLTAILDSCLGGKSSINAGGVKNLVGNIYPPNSIRIDTSFTATLDQESLVSGLCEAVKISYARGENSFEEFLNNPAVYAPAPGQAMEQLVLQVLSAKKWFIETDEFDVSERQLLNFGHSFGHALESAANFRIQHGVAVGLGMLAACRHPATQLSEHTSRLISYLSEILKPLSGDFAMLLPTIDWEEFETAIASDKKNTNSDLVLILPQNSTQSWLEKVLLPFTRNTTRTATVVMRDTLTEMAL